MLRDLLDLQPKIANVCLHFWAPGTEIRGGGLQGDDTIVAFGVGVGDVQRLQISADGLQGVDSGIVGGEVEVREAMLLLVVVFVEERLVNSSRTSLMLGSMIPRQCWSLAKCSWGGEDLGLANPIPIVSKSNRMGKAWKRGSKTFRSVSLEWCLNGERNFRHRS